MIKKLQILSVLVFLFTSPLLHAQEGFLGEIRMFGGNFAPRGWAFCNGQILAINSNQALYSILGTMYGGDGRIAFALPDFRGRVAIGTGSGPGLTLVSQGDKLGSENTVLNTNQIPQHTHPVYGVVDDGNQATPQGAFMAGTKSLDPEYSPTGTKVQMNNAVLGANSTTNQPVENREPSIGTNYIICIQGLFPIRS
tara:strand:- start:2454 stop:3041 length:588 start_codon:yes stop_codon:yes gene_type:complete